jgi:site-specific DNA-cytosine methylase
MVAQMSSAAAPKFRLLDLYCGGGLAAWGYWLSSRFSEIVGVDIDPELSTRYSFDFICGDCLALTYDFLSQFDFIHASPPCQAYSHATPDKSKHMRLIQPTHQMLFATGLPYVIENVEGSGLDLRPNLVVDGHYFGLPIERRRYFFVSQLPAPLRLMRKMIVDNSVNVHGGGLDRAGIIHAMGLQVIPYTQQQRLTIHDFEQGIPPAMTKFIAELVLPDKFRVG